MEAFQSDFACALLTDLLDRFKSLVFDEAGQIVQFDAIDELNKLERKLYKTQALLDSIEFTTNKSWQYWLEDVTRVCYDAEDLIDDMLFDATTTSVLQRIFAYLTKGTTNRKIKELQDKLEDIITGLTAFNPAKKQATQCSHGTRYDFKHTVYNNELFQFPAKLFGRDSDKEEVIALLLEETVSSVSIVGMDGLGKTTLARSVQYDSRIQEKFPHIVWVSVSATFDPSKTTEFILRRRQQGEYENSPVTIESSSHQEVHMEKCMLIVLDDLWDVKYNDWSSFCSKYLQSPGCKVLLTTSNPHVTMATKSTPHHLQLMTDDDCCALIMDRAHSSNNLSDRQRATLEDISRQMAQKCKGLPLAANILGLLLSSKSDDEWIKLSQRDICEFREYKEEIFPAFRLNNPNLASHLKKCFAYCSLFPIEFNFTEENLVQMWMAEGFVMPQGTTSLEQLGRDYFDEFICRSIFQLSVLGDNEMPTYKMHEFIRRFAEFIASDTCFRLEKGDGANSALLEKKARHLSLLCNSVKLSFLNKIERCDSLRTFLLLGEHGTHIGQVPYSLFQRLVRLRVLDLSCSDIERLPESLGRLKYLRYLDASHTHILRLPKSASGLYRLQVLKLGNCCSLLELPNDLKKLTNLQHLEVDIKRMKCMPISIGSLSCLRTLPGFIVGKKEGYQITELKNLRHLRGRICVRNLENVKDEVEAREAMISDKPLIKRLELEWRHCSRDGSSAMDVLAGIQPHNNLKELQIYNYGGPNFPAWLTSASCRLESIHVQNSLQEDALPSLGKLPLLKTLHLEGMPRVKYMDNRFSGEGTAEAFPLLETLKIKDMELLTIWSSLPDNSMPKLHQLTIEECPRLFTMESITHMSSLKTLEVNYCPELNSLPQLPTSIESLIIRESDEIKQRCQPDTGADWNIIKEIPYVEIDFEIVLPASSS